MYSVCVENDGLHEEPTAWVIGEHEYLSEATSQLLTLCEAFGLEPEDGYGEDDFCVYVSDDGLVKAYVEEFDELTEIEVDEVD